MKDRSPKPRARVPAEAAPEAPGADDDPRQAPAQERREREALDELRRKRGPGARAGPDRGRAR